MHSPEVILTVLILDMMICHGTNLTQQLNFYFLYSLHLRKQTLRRYMFTKQKTNKQKTKKNTEIERILFINFV